MTIKARIALGIAFLLTVVVLLAIVSVFHLQQVETQCAGAYTAAEAQLSQLLSSAELQASGEATLETLSLAQRDIGSIYEETLLETSTARRRLSVIGGVCALFAVAVLLWLPNYVTQPLKTFSDSIKRIAEGDLSTRIPEDRDDEFGLLAKRFNAMTVEVEKYADQNLAQVVASRNRLTTLVNNLDELILGMDSQRRVVFLNAPMARYLQLDTAETIGKYLPDLALTNPRIQSLLTPIALGRDSAAEPIRIVDADRKELYYQTRVVRLTGSDAGDLAGSEAGYIIMLSDVTAYEERTHRQSDFLATLSHEMKTPIAAIKMSLNLLEDERLGELDEDQLELTGTVRSNNDRLLRMVNEILRLSQNESGEVQLEIENVGIELLHARAAHNLAAHAKNRQVSLRLTATSDLPTVEADPERITWVIQNLLSNAIRYSPVGSDVTTMITPIAGGLQVSVSDSGPGIPREQRSRIFEKYARVSGDKTKGTGLGLAISREYVDAHGGRIYVDPTFHEGARIVFELSRRLPDHLRAKAKVAPV